MADSIYQRELTEGQERALDKADQLLREAVDEAQSVARDVHGGDAISGRCIRCSCEFFVERAEDNPGPGAPAWGCMRIGCRHLLTSHVL